MASSDRIIQQNQGPVNPDLGTPVATKPALGRGIFNSTVGTAAEKVLSASTDARGLMRRVTIVNPTAAQTLGYTTVVRGAVAPTLTSTLAGGGATDGRRIAPQSEVTVLVPDNADLYLAASVGASPYQLSIVEV